MSRRPSPSARVRLQKYLSDAGVASRRRAEELIEKGRVLVNNEVVDTLPAFVDPQHDHIIVDGARVRPQQHEYFMLHKPKGVICTNRDEGDLPAGRRGAEPRVRAVDLLPPMKERLFVVGRLDIDSTGLLLMTNDGELAEKIAHPRYGIPKVYRVEVRGAVANDLPAQARKGVYLAEGRVRASEVEIIHRSRERSALRITLREGRNREIRRLLARLGHPVKTLKRIQIGPLILKRLPVGGARRLTRPELEALHRALERPAGPRTRPQRRSAGTAKPRPAKTETPPTPAARRRPESRKRGDKPAEPATRPRRLIT
ncbi:MAG: rRNA pseudouridine synthase [Planctomycetes bacterium]|nr:rRNA pseudouridine synthase [Planctomycetota bacterium]